MPNRGKPIFSSVVALFVIGLVGLVNLMGRPRFQSFHTVDVLQLLATGMCFGVALALLFAILRGSRAQ